MEKSELPERIREKVDEESLRDFLLARVVEVHRERYVLQQGAHFYSAEITGNLRYSASSRLDFPTVGDWVKAMSVDDHTAVILEVLPRYSMLERQAIGQYAERQLIAANIDGAFIVQSPGHDFNLNRIERYLTICHHGGITPYIVLTKTDLIDPAGLQACCRQITDRVKDVPLFTVSNVTGEGYAELEACMKPGETYCFLGSSGVGKSSLVNGLAGEELLKTSEISTSTSKGRHTTSHRELLILPNKSMVIDTPGMRELGLTDQSEGLAVTYDQIHALASQCRFADCTHTVESGCAVVDALESGVLDPGVYENYQKLQREQERFTSSVREKRAKSKQQGKLYKSIMKEKKRRKFGQ